nr:wax synthase [Euglena gracilis]
MFTIPRRVKAGRKRFLLCSPVLLLNIMQPYIFFWTVGRHYCNFIPLYAAFCTWWTAFKVMAFGIGRGPLCQFSAFHKFAVVMLLPILPHGDTNHGVKDERSGSSWSSPTYLEMFAKFCGLGLCTYGISQLSHDGFPVLYNVFLSLIMYLHICVQYTGSNLATSKVLQVPLSDGMNQPYFSTSLSNFWGRRWNLVASSSLRHVVYDPIREGRLVPKGHPEEKPGGGKEVSRKVLGSLMAFLVSGIMHEYILWLATGFWSGQMLLFFVVHGVAVAAERVAKVAWARHGLPAIPCAVSIPMTIGFLFGTAELLFYPPIFSANWAEHGVADLRRQFRSLGLSV